MNCAQELARDWGPLLSEEHDGNYRLLYAEHVPQINEWTLPPICEQDIDQALRKAKKSAGGVDGFSADLLLELPSTAIQQLAQLMMHMETLG